MAIDAYQFAAGANNSGSLASLPTQPTIPCPGILYTAERYGLSGSVVRMGAYTELRYQRISTAIFNSLNSFFGIDSLTTTYIAGTFRVRFDDNTFKNFNGTIRYPYNGQKMQRGLASWMSVVYLVTNLVAI